MLVKNTGAIAGAEASAIRTMSDAAGIALVKGSQMLSSAAADAIASTPHLLASVPGQVAGQVAGAVAAIPAQVVTGVVGAVASQIPVVGTIQQGLGTLNNALGVANSALFLTNKGISLASQGLDGAAYLVGKGMEAHRAAYAVAPAGRVELLPLSQMSPELRRAYLEGIANDAVARGAGR